MNQLSMEKGSEKGDEIIQHREAKPNGEIVVKKYCKGKLLGKGGFARCYEAVSLETKEMFAMKIIDKVSLQKSRTKQKMMSEIKIHRTLNHRHIVQFNSVFESEEKIYIVLQLCKNRTLSEMVQKRKKLTVKETRYFIFQIVSALEYMHSNQVIHRDLTMGNIFLNENLEVKIGDFGLATKVQFSEEKKRTMCGTPNYVAPEIVEGVVGHSYEIDIWSTGVICYVMLFGRPPFEANDAKMIYRKIKSCDYRFPNIKVNEDAKDFIKRILVKQPKERLTIKQMYQHPFLNKEEIPMCIPVEALTTIPNFKTKGSIRFDSNATSPQPKTELKQLEQNLIKNKIDLNLISNENKVSLDGIHSPRNVLNDEVINNQKQIQAPVQVTSEQDKQQDHKIRVLVWFDSTKKYGLAYLLTNKQYGVYFNDGTLLSMDPKQKKVYYMENPALKSNNIVMSYSIKNIPGGKDFQKKYGLLEKFMGELDLEVMKLPESKRVFVEKEQFVYMKQWLKTRHAVMFALSNKIFQVNFFDNSQILLNTLKKTVLFYNIKNQNIYQTLSTALHASDSEMAKRIKYTKKILNSINLTPEQKLEPSEIQGKQY